MIAWKRLRRMRPGQLREMQDRTLREFVRRLVYPYSEFYRRLFDAHGIASDAIRCVDDLRRIPFVSKSDFLAEDGGPGNVRDFILAPDADKIRRWASPGTKLSLLSTRLLRGEAAVRARLEEEFKPVLLTATTGRSAASVSFLYSARDLDHLGEIGRRMMAVSGIPDGDRGVNAFPYAPHLAFWLAYHAGVAGRRLVVSTGGGRTLGTQGNLALIARVKPEFLIGVPAFVYHMLSRAARDGMSFPNLRTLVLGAEKVPPGFRDKITDICTALGARDLKIIGTYGFTEAKSAWSECPAPPGESSGYHLYPDREVFEVIDPDTGDVLGPGEDGELVYTSIDSRASTVLRYRTGDFVRGGIDDAPCKYCGLPLPRISSLIERVSNRFDLKLSKVKGTLVNLDHFAQLVASMPGVAEWQLVLKKRDGDPNEVDELVLYLAPANGHDPDALTEQVQADIREKMEVSVNDVCIVGRDEIDSRLGVASEMKEKRILDLRKGGEGNG